MIIRLGNNQQYVEQVEEERKEEKSTSKKGIFRRFDGFLLLKVLLYGLRLFR